MLRAHKNYTKHPECYWEMVHATRDVMKQLLNLQELVWDVANVPPHCEMPFTSFC